MKKSLIFVLASSLILGGSIGLVSCGGEEATPTNPTDGGNDGNQGGGTVTPTKEFTVTFNLNYTGAAAPTVVKVKEGEKVAKPSTPSRSGFTFNNWFENEAGTGNAFDFNTAITANKTLFAKWTENGGGGETPDPTPTPTPTPVGGILTDSKVADDHKGTAEKDASWKRYTLPVRASNSADAGFASYFACSIAGSVPSDGGADSDGFYGLGGFRSAYDATLTWTVYSSADAEMGLYFELSQHTTESMFDTLYGAKVNDIALNTSTLKLKYNAEGQNSSASDLYIFAGYVNLKSGKNTVVITRNSTAPSGGAYNWWGIRLSAQSATISDKAA